MQGIPVLKDETLLKQALTLSHRGKSPAYERLEFLGDRVLGIIVAEMIYRAFPHEKEGQMARRFAHLARAETLADVAEKIGVPERLITNENELRHNASVLADVCEAILGAVYLDGGLEGAKQFAERIWEPLMYQTEDGRDPKSALQEWHQQKYKALPAYELLEQSGSDHNPAFVVRVKAGKLSAVGSGHSKKIAEQNAAEALLKVLHGKEVK